MIPRSTRGDHQSPRWTGIRSTIQSIVVISERVISNPFIAYSVIIGLQLRVVWNFWKSVDLVYGDSSAYFVDAATWAHDLRDNLVWSPLYNMFWGTILVITRDVYAAALTERLLILFATSVMVLVIGRALLCATPGLLIAMWWVVTPNDHNFLYEVHPFGFLPPLLAVLAVVLFPRRIGIGIALGLLLIGALLDRNELIIAFALVLIVAISREIAEIRKKGFGKGVDYIIGYGIPLAVSSAIIYIAIIRSYISLSGAWLGLKDKNELNLCQSFAFAYQQQTPTKFTGNPFTQCTTLMQHLFGAATPSTLQATMHNPAALANFFLWNLHKLPAGIQVALFGSTSLSMNPSVLSVPQRPVLTLVLSILVLSLLIGAIVLAWSRGWLTLRERSPRVKWALVVVASIALADVAAGVFSSPLPEYLYGVTIAALIAIGWSVKVIARSIGAVGILSVVAVLLVPIAFVFARSMYAPAPRPTLEVIRHLQLVQRLLQRPGSVLVSMNTTYANSGYELCNYLAEDYARHCTGTAFGTIESTTTTGRSLGRALRNAHASVLYADGTMVDDPKLKGLLSSRHAGWRQIAHGSGSDGPWSVIVPLSHVAPK